MLDFVPEGRFVGRLAEQDQFRSVMAQLEHGAGRAGPSSLILIQGRGGIGKTWLLRRFYEIACTTETNARAPARSRVVPVWIDWEDERDRHPDIYLAPTGPDLLTILVVLQQAVLGLTSGHRSMLRRAQKEFEAFRQTASSILKAGQNAEREKIGGISADPAATAGRFAGEVADALIPFVPGASLAKPLAGSVPAVTAFAVATGRRLHAGGASHAAFDLATRPSETVVEQFATALRAIAATRPIVFLLDTAELISPRSTWIADLAQQTGDRIAWVLAGRITAESDRTGEPTYSRPFPSTSTRVLPIARFTSEHTRQILVQHIPADQVVTAMVNHVTEATRGVPLAIRLAARLVATGADVSDVLQPTTRAGTSSDLVRDLAERYLVHARLDPALRPDLPRLYGLALIHGDRSDPQLLRALWPSTENIEQTLEELTRRHDFVLSGSRHLHQDVRHAIRLYLLDAVRREQVAPANRDAARVLEARLHALAADSLAESLQDADWRATATALLWHLYWADNDTAQAFLAALLPTSALLNEDFARGLLSVGHFFINTFTQRQRAVFRGMAVLVPLSPIALVFQGRTFPGTDTPILLDEFESYRARPLVTVQADVVAAFTHLATTVTRPVQLPQDDDRPIALQFLKFRAEESALLPVADGEHRIGALKQLFAETRDTRLSAAADKFIKRHLDRFNYYDEDADGLKSEIAEFAIEFDPGNRLNWWHVADIRAEEGKTEDALAAWNVVIDMDPSSPWPYFSRALVSKKLGRNSEALTDIDRYLELEENPQPFVYAERSRLRYAAGRFEEALQDSDRELAMSESPDPYEAWLRAYILYAMRRYADALDSMQRALDLAGLDAAGISNRALLLILTGEHAEALAVLETVVSSDTEGPDLFAQLLLGLLRRAARIANADECFRAALAAERTLTPFRSAEFRAIAHSCLGNGEQGLAELANAAARRLPYDVYDEPLYALIRGLESVELGAIAAIEAIVAAPYRSHG